MTMTEYKIQNISHYAFTSSDNLMFDTNVWFFMYAPQKPIPAVNKAINIYSDALKKMRTAGSHIFINPLIISEFVNIYAKRAHELLSKNGKASNDFKAFRNSPKFKPIAQDIAFNVKSILKHCVVVESGFKPFDIKLLIDDYALGVFDFNDQIIAAMCKEAGITLVTHDIDFKDFGLSILTANEKLI